LNAGSIAEGGTFTLAGGFTDPGVLDAHTVVIDWGTGEAQTTLALAAGVTTFTADHRFADDSRGGSFAVSRTVTDADGGAAAGGTFTAAVTVADNGGGTGSAATAVAVANVAPAVAVTATPVVDEGGTVTLTGTLTDPGVLDAHTVTVNWGEGVSEVVSLAAGV